MRHCSEKVEQCIFHTVQMSSPCSSSFPWNQTEVPQSLLHKPVSSWGFSSSVLPWQSQERESHLSKHEPSLWLAEFPLEAAPSLHNSASCILYGDMNMNPPLQVNLVAHSLKDCLLLVAFFAYVMHGFLLTTSVLKCYFALYLLNNCLTNFIQTFVQWVFPLCTHNF